MNREEIKYEKINIEEAIKAVSNGKVIFYEGIGKVKKPINNLFTKSFCEVLTKYSTKLYIKSEG